jgi:hypothetical protein
VVASETTKDHIQQLFVQRPEIVESISGIVAARRLRTRCAMVAESSPKGEEVRETIAGQLLSRIRAFFATTA